MIAKLRLVFSISMAFLGFCALGQVGYWDHGRDMPHGTKLRGSPVALAQGKVFSLEESVFRQVLHGVPSSGKGDKVIYFPDAQGQLLPFSVQEKSILSRKLADRFPQIKSYIGTDGQGRRIRFSISPKGMECMMVDPARDATTFIQKTAPGSYAVYAKDASAVLKSGFACKTLSLVEKTPSSSTMKPVDGQVLRKLRLAVSASGEYTQYHGGTVADALAAINATVTRINEIFETDLAVTLELVANTDAVIYTDPSSDPYTGNLNSQVQTTLDNTIGATNYDIGHLFDQGDNGGNAGYVGSVCVNGQKGSAYSSGVEPEGDIYDLDFVAHEMGHQLGANHTWSFESEGTTVQVEPGSGTTIMGYAGITGIENVAEHGDDYFHYVSIAQIADYLDGVSCANVLSLTNSPPETSPLNDYVIPRSTAFVLTGAAVDPDSADVLTYAWEQIDNGIVGHANFGPTNPGGANFRSHRPGLDPTRYFPSLSRVLQGKLTQDEPIVNSAWETVSDVERAMHFAFTVRDNALGGGQVVSQEMTVQVVDDAGPFMVTSQDSGVTYPGGSVQTVSWDVAGTDMPPVGTLAVDIFLSTDGGITYPTILASNVPNDGDHKVQIPSVATSMARIMVKAHDNVYFAVNSMDFQIQPAPIFLDFPQLGYDVCQGDLLDLTFGYVAESGFLGVTEFSVISGPPELSVTFNPVSVSQDTLVHISVTGTGTLPEGVYSLIVQGQSDSVTQTVPLEVHVLDATFPDVALIAPDDGAQEASVGTILEWMAYSNISTYEIQIATDAAFTQIIESAVTLSNTYAPIGLDHDTTYYWRVKAVNSCGEGDFGASWAFTTIMKSCMHRSSANLPLEISATGTPTVTSTINFYQDLVASDIKVNLDLDHEFLSDLTISLTSPSGTTILLVANACGDLKNINATFSQDAPPFDCIGNPAISGTVAPQGSLDVFKGESIMGQWELKVVDNAPRDGGLIKAFSLEVCAEGAFRPDADNDGVFDDGEDLCPGTQPGAEVDMNGCAVYRFPNDNFKIQAVAETCRNQNNGAIEVVPKLPLDYTVKVSGNGVSRTEAFTGTYTLDGLGAGEYTVCLGGTDGGVQFVEQCFMVSIKEPAPLAVSSDLSLDGRTATLHLSGSDLYYIDINGTLMTSDSNKVSLDLGNGTNTVRVYTGKSCQGIYEERFFTSEATLVSPNPFIGTVGLYLGQPAEQVTVGIYAVNGKLMRKEVRGALDRQVDLDFTGYASGMYIIRYEAPAFKGTSKVYKQ